MGKPLTVYGGCFDGTTRMIVAARSGAAAARLFGVSYYAFRQQASDTGNATEIAVATMFPGEVLCQPVTNDRAAWVRGVAEYRQRGPWPPVGAKVISTQEQSR